jgi:hypothetical protein
MSGAEVYELYMLGFLLTVFIISAGYANKWAFNNWLLFLMWASLGTTALIFFVTATFAFTVDDTLTSVVERWLTNGW